MARVGAMGMGVGARGPGGVDEIDGRSRFGALARAEEGADRAAAAGLVASPPLQTSSQAVATAVLAVAAEIDADLVVVGTRGRTGMTSSLLGGVAHAGVQHADRPVLVVPSHAVAASRRARAGERAARA